MNAIQFKRKLDPQLFSGNNFFLGPRKTGKSTYLRFSFPNSLYIDLLNNKVFSEYSTVPGSLYEFVTFQLSNNSNLRPLPIIIDEIQRIPLLLNDVHRLIEEEHLDFILCGSSARRLVRGGANMLGGRAGKIVMGGLSVTEIPSRDFNLLRFLNNGGIPSHYLSKRPQEEIRAYFQNYIQEEIKGEALTRNIQSFNRFLDLLGMTNGEEVNYTNISRDVGVDSKTIKEYFQILIDTLLGTYLNPFFDKKKRTNILKSPKFYLFDTGVANFLKGILLQKEEGLEFGRTFEHMVFNEIQNYKNYHAKDFSVSFWRTYEKNEVDFILGDGQIAIEVKGKKSISSSDTRSLRTFSDVYHPQRSIIVSNTAIPRKLENNIEILPWREFLKILWSGNLI